MLIEYGEGKEPQFVVVPGADMFEPVAPDVSRRGPDRFESVFKGEDAITSALIRLREGKKSRIAFTTGHGEPSTADVNPRSQGIGIWRAQMASIGCEPVDLNLLKDAIPDDLALLCIVGPRNPFKPEEIAKLTPIHEQGRPRPGSAGQFRALGPGRFPQVLQPGAGPRPRHRSPVQLQRQSSTGLHVSQGKSGASHRGRPAVGAPVLIHNGAPIQVLGLGPPAPGQAANRPVNPNLVPMVLLRSGPQSWAETDLTNRRPRFDKDADQQGPVPVGVAVQERAPAGASPKPRLVLFSSADLASNLIQQLEPTNLDLVMNATSWLRGRPDAVGIAASTHVALTLTADPLLRNRLVLVPTVMATLFIIAAGLIVYLVRRE